MKYITYFALIILGIFGAINAKHDDIRFLCAMFSFIVMCIAYGVYTLRKIIHG